jgi:hypothetical protein
MNDGNEPDPDADYFRMGLVFVIVFTIFMIGVFTLTSMYVRID